MNTTTRVNKLFDFTIPTLIVGMGGTGLSCARYLDKNNCLFAMADSRQEPLQIGEIKKEFPQISFITGEFNLDRFKGYQQFIVSPGISIRNELFQKLQQQGCLVIGDIELFAQVVEQPVIAITGSNGKSTVTTLVEKIANDCGVNAVAGGNLGTPALDLLESKSELYILELSSFQLETTYSLKTLSATVLNVSEDHMDRYNDLEDYRRVKESIYQNTEYAVINRDESMSAGKQIKDCHVISFGSDRPEQDNYGLVKVNHSYRLNKGSHTFVQSDELRLKGIYNFLNILAALALLEPLKLNEQQQNNAVKNYKGLAHRCEWVEAIAGVQYYNDSKGTNTGATIAAIKAFETNNRDPKTILIAGGVGKDADFSELGKVIERKIKATILMGADSGIIKKTALKAGTKNKALYTVDSMQDAVLTANKLAKTGDVVLFSPACASFDMYQNYIKRGEDFKEKVRALKLRHEKEGLKNVC